MARERHHAIVVSSYAEEHAERARVEALRLGCTPTEIIGSELNGVLTFLVPPDGAYEGLGPSWEGDQRRNAIAEWLNQKNAEFGDLAPYR
jgi:hypothetical protein